MGLFDRLFGSKPNASGTGSIEDLFDKLLTGGFNSTLYFSNGTSVRGSQQSLSTAYRCMILLGSAVASTPLEIKDKDGNIVPLQAPPRADMPNGQYDGLGAVRAWGRLFNTGFPDGRLDRYQFLRQLTIDLINRGNVFLLPKVSMDGKTSMEIVRPTLQGTENNYVSSLPLDELHWEVYDLLGNRKRVNRLDLIHIFLPVMGMEVSSGRLPLGMPIARVVADAVAGGKAADQFVIEAIAAANRRGLSLTTAGNLETNDEIDKYYRFGDRTKGNAKIALTDGGADWKELKGPTEMLKAVGEAREQQKNDVALAYGVPAPLVNQSSSAWAAGVEQLARVYLRFSVRPVWWKMITSALTAALLPAGYSFEFNDADFLRGDWKAWAALAGAATQSGSISIEELRDAGGFPRYFPPGDTKITTPYDPKQNGLDTNNTKSE